MKKKHIISAESYGNQPLWFKALNRLWKLSYPLGTRVKLDKDDIIKSARKTTGLNDLGKDFNDEPLERLLRSVNEEAHLHPVGAFISKQRLLSLVSIRLRAEEHFRLHPEILEQELYPVTMIVGLQRTGTTKLQRLLAADPDHRVLRSWEAINPVPLDMGSHSDKKRIRIAKTSETALKYMAPGFFAIHPVEHQAPEEDILLLDVSFLSTTPEATMHVPSYAEWLEKTDQSPAYAYAVKLLKLLQWQQPGKRWILKSPHHLEFLDLVEKYYGDVNFLWTHRNVNESIPSFLSMVSHSQVIFSDHVKKEEVAHHWIRKAGYMLRKGLEYRNKPGNSVKFTDIHYKEFIAEPIKILKEVYSYNGGWKPYLEETFRQADSRNPRNKYGCARLQADGFRPGPRYHR